MRNIFIVNATQVVTSDSNPQGVYSIVSGYPKTYDSRNYNATEQNPNGEAMQLCVRQKASISPACPRSMPGLLPA